MHTTSLGNHEMGLCSHCGRLFHAETVGDNVMEARDKIKALYNQHIEQSPKCLEARDALPSMRDLQDEFKRAIQTRVGR